MATAAPKAAGGDCAACGKPLPRNGGYSFAGESPQCSRCYRKRWRNLPLKTLASYEKVKAEAKKACDHGVTFNYDAAAGLSSQEVRKRWPRLMGSCPKGCGYNGIAYASTMHYTSGDW